MGLKQQMARVKQLTTLNHRQLIIFSAGLIEASVGKGVITDEDLPAMINKVKEQVN